MCRGQGEILTSQGLGSGSCWSDLQESWQRCDALVLEFVTSCKRCPCYQKMSWWPISYPSQPQPVRAAALCPLCHAAAAQLWGWRAIPAIRTTSAFETSSTWWSPNQFLAVTRACRKSEVFIWCNISRTAAIGYRCSCFCLDSVLNLLTHYKLAVSLPFTIRIHG